MKHNKKNIYRKTANELNCTDEQWNKRLGKSTSDKRVTQGVTGYRQID